MKTIFEKIKGREWDWFEGKEKDKEIIGNELVFIISGDIPYNVSKSLADLLANKSFTDACGLSEPQILIAFVTLRNEGQEACIEYIKKTML
jgi:hypothetical protein